MASPPGSPPMSRVSVAGPPTTRTKRTKRSTPPDTRKAATIPAAEPLLAQLATTADPAQQKTLSQQLMKVFADNAPVVPMWPQPTFDEYSTKRFTGWPTKDDPYVLGTPQQLTPDQLLIMTAI